MKTKLKTSFLLLLSFLMLASCAADKSPTSTSSTDIFDSLKDSILDASSVSLPAELSAETGDASAEVPSDVIIDNSDIASANFDYLLGMKEFAPTQGTLDFSSFIVESGDEAVVSALQPLTLAQNMESSISRPATVIPVLKPDFAIEGVPAHLISQAYTIEVADSITVTAGTAQGIYYGALSVSQYMKAQGCMAKGTYSDWPDVAGRALHLDIARKYLPKDWIIETVKSAAAYKINEVELHFSENEGFRIECETDPAIMSDEYLTKDEVREIIAVAKQYFVEIVPSFDSPGHLLKVLSVHPEYQLVDVDGYRSAKTLDITNPKAVDYMKSLLDEYAELFKDCKYFNIGGDESFGWGNIDRMHFSAWKVLENHAKASYGDAANAHDSFVAYINDIAAHMEAKGFTVRAWNDGLMRRRGQAKVQSISTSVDICYWSDSSSLSASKVELFLSHGSPVYNVNEEYMYYVLKEDFEQPDAELIFDEWNAGVFCGSKVSLDNFGEKIRGAYFCIWCDRADTQTPEQITEGTFASLRAMAVKSWNSNPQITFPEFEEQIKSIK